MRDEDLIRSNNIESYAVPLPSSLVPTISKEDSHLSLTTVGYHFRDALRLLFILVAGSVPIDGKDEDKDTLRVFMGEKRLMAIDFLVRYPDYLADELLDLYEKDQESALLRAVQSIFDNNEPDIRQVSMVRWRRGAFQNIETALAILDARMLVKPKKKILSGGRTRYDYILGLQAVEFLAQAVLDIPTLCWYQERVALAMRIAEHRSGSLLKEEQYEHDEYRNTAFGAVIPSIKDRVLKRLQKITGHHT
jgi:hypothetical protein